MKLLPCFQDAGIVDGNYIHVLPYCLKSCNSSKCKEHYCNIQNKSGFHRCPHGLTSYVDAETGLIFTGFRCKPYYSTQQSKMISTNAVYNPILQIDQIKDLVALSIQIDQKQTDLSAKEAQVESISHEAKKLNAQIKERCDSILQRYSFLEDENGIAIDKNAISDIQSAIKTIYVSAALVDSRFSLVNYENNPEALKQGSLIDCTIYKKFHKCQKIFKNYQKKGIPISIQGESYATIKAYKTFELIPILIIENAVKYSLSPENPVEIVFDDFGNGYLNVSITSFSPYCSPTEITHLFEKGFRGANAKKTPTDGSGIGLYFVKLLCDIHGVEIKVKSDPKASRVGGIPYSLFTVQLSFPHVTYYKG